MKKIKNGGALFVIIGIIAIILAIVCSSMPVGYSELAKTYGGDAYTGIQQAAAQTANNVKMLAEIVRFGFSAILAIVGLFSIAYGLKGKKSQKTEAAPQQTANVFVPQAPVAQPVVEQAENIPEQSQAD